MSDHTLPLSSLQSETREIPLTRGKIAIVDAADYEYLSQFKWQAQPNKPGKYYAFRYGRKPDGTKTRLAMHREILGVTDPSVDVDHKDGDGLNNTRNNLRPATSQQNNCNKGPGIRNTTGYKGVSWSQYMRKFKAGIMLDGKERHLGYFYTDIEAAHAYDIAASELHGEFAYLNFPPGTNVLKLINHAEREALSVGRYRYPTKEEVWEIRKLYAADVYLPYAFAAEKFGFAESTIIRVVKGQSHANIPNPDGSAFEPIEHRDVRQRLSNTSEYKGVHWHKSTGKWAAQIRQNGKRRHLGVFATAEEAALAVERAQIE